MNKCNIYGVQVYSLYYQIVPGRLVGSKKCPVALSDVVSINVGCFSKKFERIQSPECDGSGFLCVVHRKYICLLKRYPFYRDSHSLQFSCEEA